MKTQFLFLSLTLMSCYKKTTIQGFTTSAVQSNTSTTTEDTSTLNFTDGASYNFGTGLTGLLFSKTLTLSNSSTSDMTALSGKVSSPFAFKDGTFPGTAGTCTTKLSVGEKCTVVVTLTSTVPVSSTSNLTISYKNKKTSKTATISLSGAIDKFVQRQKLVGTGTNGRIASDNFGRPTSLYGDTLAVGAFLQDYDENGANLLADAGAVYVYTRTNGTWTLQQKLVGTGTNGRIAGDRFGCTISLYEDTLAVGAYLQDYDESGANSVSNAGAAYIFKRSGNVWTLQQKLVGQGTNGRVAADQFGWNISLYKDTVAVAANVQGYDENGANLVAISGAVYIFTRSNSTWTFQQKLVGQGTNGRVATDYFGSVVSLYEDTVAVGVGNHDYDENGNNLITDAGCVFVFIRTANVWSVQQKLVGQGTNGRVTVDQFGLTLSLNGETLAVGALKQDFDENGGDQADDAGAVFIFTRSSGVWSLQQKIVGRGAYGRTSGDFFGGGISVYGDIMAVSAYNHDSDLDGANLVSNAGIVNIYARSGSVWSFQQKVSAVGTNSRGASDLFGAFPSLNGTTLAIGALGHDYDENGANAVSDAGAVFIESL